MLRHAKFILLNNHVSEGTSAFLCISNGNLMEWLAHAPNLLISFFNYFAYLVWKGYLSCRMLVMLHSRSCSWILLNAMGEIGVMFLLFSL